MLSCLGSVRIRVQQYKGLCCEERRQEVDEEGGSQSIPGPLFSQDSSPLTDHFHKHRGVGPCTCERITTFSYSYHLPEVFSIFSQHTIKSRSQARQSPMETFLKKYITPLSFSHFCFIRLPLE